MEPETETTAIPPAPRRPRGASALTLVVAGLLVTLLAACGGSSASSGGGASSSPTTTPSAAGVAAPSAATLQAFQSCLSQHGVTLPTFTPRTTTPGQSPPSSRPPGSGGGGAGGGGVGAVFANPADQTAVKACQNMLPAAYVAQLQARADQRAAFDSCMADHGVTSTQPSPGTTPTTLDTSSAAYKTCSPLLPSRPQNGGSGPTTTIAGA